MRYFFDLRHSGRVYSDIEGVEFETIEQVRQEAQDGARDIIAERIKGKVPIDVSTAFEIKDESGQVVYSLPFAKVLLEALTVSE